MKIFIGTRGSRLALAQAEYVRNILMTACPQHSFEIKVITTKGDRITDRPLASIGGKGLFVREIEEQLLSGEVHLAVHSMKDMPVIPAKGLAFTRTWRREDPRDVLVLREKASLSELPEGAVVGTGSIRRQAQLRLLRPDLRLVGIRGNIDTRLRKMEEQNLDGIVLAAAGLHRLGMENHITQYFSYKQMVPSPAQGALALEIREDACELRELLDQFAHEESAVAVEAEREFLRLCGGDCHMPVGALCEKKADGTYHLRVVFGKDTGEDLVFADAEGTDVRKMAEEAVSRLAIRPYSGDAGIVYLVGAGPGDPGLITVRGRELLQWADCVVYDRLIPKGLLGYTKPGCELVYVGKENHHHVMRQEEINALLARKAAEHHCVVRLKGGDPFVFGRGGEEALALLEQGIQVELVPGVTSAVAGAACAGIPVTHRGLSGGFHVVTAHDCRDELADIDFDAMARSGDTAVFLMGLSKLAEITSRLQAAGMAAGTAAAVISHASLPDQKVCQGTLAEIAGKAREEGLASPALIVVGEVVKLRERLGILGRKKMPVSCLVPKIGKQPSVLAARLREQGMDVEELQVGEIIYRGWQMDPAEEKIPDWLIFSSRHGVEGFFRGMMKAGADIRAFARSKVAAIGSKTAEKLEQYGMKPDLVPEKADSMGLCELLNKVLEPEDVVWYLKAEETAGILQDGISGSCHLVCKNVYTNQEVREKPNREFYDSIVFTCASSASRLFSDENIFPDSRLYSIGPVCTEQLRRLGRKNIIQADRASYEGLAAKIYEVEREKGES